MTALDEASKCPKCGMTGERGRAMDTERHGVKVIMFTCKTVLCRWFETGWPVQINPDGSIPEPTLVGPKQFLMPDNPNLQVDRARTIAGEYS